jgi:hypothetical protein
MTAPMTNVSPELFFDTANAFQRSAALKAAIELNVFTEIGEGSTASVVAEKCKASQRGMRILLDYLVVIGFLQKEKDVYKCTPDSAVFLNKKSPAYLGSAVDLLNAPVMMSAYENLAEVVRKGTTSLPEGGLRCARTPDLGDFRARYGSTRHNACSTDDEDVGTTAENEIKNPGYRSGPWNVRNHFWVPFS